MLGDRIDIMGLERQEVLSTTPLAFRVEGGCYLLETLGKPDPILAVATRAAMMDDGIAWLMGVLVSSAMPGGRSDPSP